MSKKSRFVYDDEDLLLITDNKEIEKSDQKIDVVGENIPDWDWPNGSIDEFLDSLKTNKSSKIEKSNKHEKWL